MSIECRECEHDLRGGHASGCSRNPNRRNRFGVPLRQWRRWTPLQRLVFNRTFDAMEDQEVFLHPRAPRATKAQWATTRWNAAWIAADAVKGEVLS